MDPTENDYLNSITITGFICKDVIYRTTPKGREIGDMLVAVNRAYGKSDYIPCIAWGRNARFAKGMALGSHIAITGRIQSRAYNKKIDEDTFEERVAYELSVSRLSYASECEDDFNRPEVIEAHDLD